MDKPENAVKLKLKANKKYSLCTCGKSDTLPYCDNNHRIFNDENGTNFKSLKVIPEEDTIILVSSSTWENTEKSIRNNLGHYQSSSSPSSSPKS